MARPFRVLVTGSRTVTNAQAHYIRQALEALRYSTTLDLGHRPMVVVQGECPYGGVDKVAKEWAESEPGVTAEGHPADWDRLGKKAGPARNSHMVKLGADICLAFPGPGSRGTWDCLQKAVDAGIEPRLYPLHLVDGGDDE